MSKRKSLPIKLSLTNSDEESKNIGEFKANESDFEDDNGVFEEDTATELNSETEDTDSPQLSNSAENKRNLSQPSLGTDKASSAMLNSLSQQAMKRKHKKFRPSESEENVENFTNNMNNGSSNSNLSSLMSLAMGNSQSAYDLFALSSMGNGQLLSTLARFASANNNHQDQQPATASKEHNQPTKNNNGIFRRRKRSELDEDEDNEPKDEYNDLKATDQTANLLAAISNLQQPQPTANSNDQQSLAQMVGQLSGGRKAPSENEVKQENDRKLLEVIKQFNDLKEKLMLNQQQSEVPNGNSLANGSAFNNLQLDIVSGYSLFPFLSEEYSVHYASPEC